ncbi:NAD(P)-binding protein [Ophiobolus disseminans]|uniref:NAD(P)-binding protein n=1 Tax=Ophiobolus disseminans TaxID=1469910 RepID=A0A6A7AJU8_9PLEO|nr:NAD(P)-binding protein [Ophiobolus disseminans]
MGQKFSSFWDQSFFIPPPTFTDKHLPDQTGKVHIITGGYTGVGYHLARHLFSRNATLYLAGRTESKARSAITQLRALHPTSTGRLEFLYIDLSNLTTIKPAIDAFLAKETRLDVLVNNAAVMYPPDGSKSVQGYDLQTATNVYGPFLLSVLLYPMLRDTVGKAETSSVRIVWCASHAPDLFGTKEQLGFVQNTIAGEQGKMMLREGFGGAPVYAQSKAADIVLGVECARRWGGDGISSTSLHPGNLLTELVRYRTGFEKWVAGLMNHPAEMGAWTELYAGWSPEVAPEMSGRYYIPWGRVGRYNADLERAIAEGKGEKLWEVCEGIVEKYM